MIVLVQFQKEKPLMCFGDTPGRKWHKRFREYCSKFRPTLCRPISVLVMDKNFTDTGFKWMPLGSDEETLKQVAHLLRKCPPIEEKVTEIVIKAQLYQDQ